MHAVHKDVNHHRQSIEINMNWIAGGRCFDILFGICITVQHYCFYYKLPNVGYHYRTTPKDVPQNVKQILLSSKSSVLAEKTRNSPNCNLVFMPPIFAMFAEIKFLWYMKLTHSWTSTFKVILIIHISLTYAASRILILKFCFYFIFFIMVQYRNMLVYLQYPTNSRSDKLSFFFIHSLC